MRRRGGYTTRLRSVPNGVYCARCTLLIAGTQSMASTKSPLIIVSKSGLLIMLGRGGRELDEFLLLEYVRTASSPIEAEAKSDMTTSGGISSELRADRNELYKHG